MGNPQHPSKPGDVPDLDLGPLVPRRAEPNASAAPAARSAAPPKAASSAGALDYFGTGFEEDHFDAGSNVAARGGAATGNYDGASLDLDDEEGQAKLSLELSSYRPPAPAGSMAPAEPALPLPSGAPGAPSRAPPQASLAPLPSVDSGAVGLLAGYGPAPSAIYLAPLYAFRVFTRKRALGADLARVNAELGRAENKLDEQLASLASGVRGELENDARFGESFAPVQQLESIAGERGAQLNQTNEQFQNQNSALVQQLEAVDQQRPPLDQEKERLSTDVAAREAELARVVARQKRFLIEARSVKMSAEQRPAGTPQGAPVPIPPEALAQIQALEAQAASVQPEVDQHKQELAATQSALQAVRNQLGALAQHTRRIQEHQKALERQFQGQLKAASAGFSEAQGELTRALAAVGRLLLAQQDGLSLDPAILAAIRATEAELRRLNESNAMHLAALDAYDRETVKRGTLLVGGAAALIVLVIVLLALR